MMHILDIHQGGTPPVSSEEEARYAPAAVAQLTGVSAHALRAWERRYRAVEPQRTAGGARRYSDREVARLRLLRRAVDAGHAISEVAGLSDEDLARHLDPGTPAPRQAAATGLPIEAILEEVRAMEIDRFQRSLALQLAALGPRSFARDLAGPLLVRIGEEWERGDLSISAEHAATSALRNLLGSALRHDPDASPGPIILFATPAGERHELGALIAAIYAVGAGARALFLGADLPAVELADAARRLGAQSVALSVGGLEPERAGSEVRALRLALSNEISILVGGRGVAALSPIPGVTCAQHLEEIEDHVSRIPC